jgi:hypothetical protein
VRLARFLSTWIAEHPRQAVGVGILLLFVLVSCSPLLVSLVPVRKVPLRYNLRNLQIRWRTTLVTGLAFTLVTTLLTVMLAFVKGMDRLTEGSGHPGNVIVLSDGATDEAFSNLPPLTIPNDLPDALQKMIAYDGDNCLATKEVYVIVTQVIPNAAPGSRNRRFVQMRGLDDIRIAARVHEIELSAGDWPSPNGVRTVTVQREGQSVTDVATEVIMGQGVARLLAGDVGKEILAPGDVVEIGNRLWVVAGIMQPGTNTFGSEIWTRDNVLQVNFGRNNPISYSSYVVRTNDANIAELAANAIKEFRSSRNFLASPERVYYSKLSDTNRQFSFAIYVVALVMAAGGILGIMNTMFAAISQRTKDIGVLRLMGYRRWQIFMSFQLESLVIAILGGGLGLLIGYLIADGRTATSIMSSGAGGGGKSIVLQLTVDLGVLGIGLFFSLLMGAVGGIIPSFNAMRLRPLDSLK